MCEALYDCDARCISYEVLSVFNVLNCIWECRNVQQCHIVSKAYLQLCIWKGGDGHGKTLFLKTLWIQPANEEPTIHHKTKNIAKQRNSLLKSCVYEKITEACMPCKLLNPSGAQERGKRI